MVLDLTHYALRHTAAISPADSALLCIALTIAAAVLLNRLIAEPFEKLRNRFRAS